MDVFRRKVFQPAAQQLERVQCDVYGQYVWIRNLFQPAAQLERVQCDVYVPYVLGRKVFQPAAQQLERVQCGGYGKYVSKL